MRVMRRGFVWAQVAAMGVVAAAAAMVPEVGVVVGTLTMMAVWALCIGAYRLTPRASAGGGYVLLVAFALLAVGVLANMHLYTAGAEESDAMPMLTNDDAARYFHRAESIAKGDVEGLSDVIQQGYPWFIAQIWRVTGISIFAPLVANMAMILGAIIVAGMVCGRILRGERSELWGMIATASVCYYLATGTLLLKEAGTALAMAIAGYALTFLIYPEGKRWKVIAIFALSMVMLGVFRFNYIPIVAVGVAIATPWRRDAAVTAGAMLAVCAAVWCVNHYVLLPSEAIDTYMSGLDDGSTMRGNYFYDHPQHRAHNEMVGNYFEYPLWKKILWLPISAITQFLIPFPWGMERDISFGYTLVWARIAYPWYLIGGVIIYGLWQAIRSRKGSAVPARWIVLGVALWLIPAYLFAGTVSRYALCFVPLLVPLAVDAIERHGHRRAFKIYAGIYVVVLAATLIVCYHIQSSAL